MSVRSIILINPSISNYLDVLAYTIPSESG